MLQYRITKYDPARRDDRGAFLDDDWTAVSDIGRCFAGVILTVERYKEVEAAYVTTACDFLKEAGFSPLQISGLENRGEPPLPFKEGDLITCDGLPVILRHLLREELWCRLEAPEGFFHAGYDLYMYIGVPCPCPKAQRAAQKRGLFGESFLSPYLRDEE